MRSVNLISVATPSSFQPDFQRKWNYFSAAVSYADRLEDHQARAVHLTLVKLSVQLQVCFAESCEKVREYSTRVDEMMACLGIEPGAGVLPRLSLRYATALRRCEDYRSEKACSDWLDYAPSLVNFAPDFCMNAA